MHLVRHARGEKGDYVSVNNTDEMDTVAAMSGKMASLYYQEVLVCENCYKVPYYPPPLCPTPFLPFLSHDHLLVPLECHLPYLTINCNHPRQLLTSLVLPSASYPLLTPHYHMLLFTTHYSLFTTPYSLL